MKATELRIGNILKPNEQHYAAYGEFNTGIVTAIQEDRLTVSNHYPGKWFEGIPLTEEWLIKFGFEKHHGMWQPKYFESNHPGLFYVELFENEKYHLSGPDTGKCSVPIEYVHQLQNLYFALTGEELTLK
jgi:hypothetical protein